jgi:hypothetical protein
MNLEKLKDKKIVLFGKSRSFSMDEFMSQLKFHKIDLTSKFDESVVLVVDGKMMTPYEQNESDALYSERSGVVEFVSIDVLEKELAKQIDPNTLLMSLKLSRNKERLKSFIQNSMIDDELFFKLLKMYSWSGEDFFENDDNRDVSAAIIGRFYKNIERNHNVQYATSGFGHLISQSNNQELIEMIASLEPLQKSPKEGMSDANINILFAIASHKSTPKSVLNTLIKRADREINRYIAMRDDCDEEIVTKLYDSMDESILEALSYSKNLSKVVVYNLVKESLYATNLATNLELDGELFELFIEEYAIELAKNHSLLSLMQESLFQLNKESVDLSLAQNSFVDPKIVSKLLKRGSKRVLDEICKNSITSKEILQEAYKESSNYLSLSQNSATPADILLSLSQSGDSEILRYLAQNPSTPVEVLYQLQLDAKLARFVKENPAFGRYIQQENIGWEV